MLTLNGKGIRTLTLLLIVSIGIYYLIDTIRIRSNVQHAVRNAIKVSLQAEVDRASHPSAFLYTVPANDRTDVYLVYTDGFRILNVNDFWVQRDLENSILLDVNELQGPVCKITGFNFMNVQPQNVSMAVDVKYVDPFGIIRSTRTGASVPLIHMPLS